MLQEVSAFVDELIVRRESGGRGGRSSGPSTAATTTKGKNNCYDVMARCDIEVNVSYPLSILVKGRDAKSEGNKGEKASQGKRPAGGKTFEAKKTPTVEVSTAS